jgi:hypothetical protein
MRVSALIILLAITSWTLSAQTRLSVSGVVLEAGTDRPLEGVIVSATSSGATQKADTDSAGRFTIYIPTPGRYLLIPARNGMVFSRPARLQIPRDPGVWVELGSGSAPNVELRMVREAVITGQIADSNGKTYPAVQGKVDVYQSGYDEYGKRKLIPVPVVHQGAVGTYGRMDDRGIYRLYGLQPGDYYIAGGGGGTRLFYPGTPDESSALLIHVNAGDEVRLSAITLPTPQITQVRFRFVGAEAGSVATSAVIFPNKDRVRIVTPGPLPFGGPMPADPDVRSIGLAPGRYDQFFGLTGMRNTEELFYGKATFDVGKEETRIDIPVSRGIRVNGSLTLEDVSGARDLPSGVFCKLYTSEEHAETLSVVNKGCLGASFSPALYELEITGMPPDAYVESAQAGGEDVLAKGLQLNADTELKIVLRTPGSIVEGVVRDSKGERLSDAVVALVPDAPLRSAGVLYRSHISDVEGRYQLRGVAPGSYHLFAWTELAGAAFRNEQFLKEYEGKARPVEIEKGARISADITAF